MKGIDWIFEELLKLMVGNLLFPEVKKVQSHTPITMWMWVLSAWGKGILSQSRVLLINARTSSSLPSTSSGTIPQGNPLALEGKGLSRMKRITSCLWEDGSTLNSAAAQPAGTHRHCILHCWTSKVLEPKLSQEKGNAINYCVSIQHYTLSFNVLQIKGEVLYSIDDLRQGKWGLGPPYMKKKKKR